MPGYWIYQHRSTDQWLALEAREPALEDCGRWDLRGAPFDEIGDDAAAWSADEASPTAMMADKLDDDDWAEIPEGQRK